MGAAIGVRCQCQRGPVGDGRQQPLAVLALPGQGAVALDALRPQAHDLLLQPGDFLRLGVGVLCAAALQCAVATQQHTMLLRQVMDVFFKVWHDATAPCQVGLRKGWPPHRQAWPAAS